MIVCAGEIESFTFAKTIGIGLLQSSINLTKICIENKPSSILFIGTAGSYGKHKIFDILESSSSCNIELSHLDKNSYTPLDMNITSNNKTFKNTCIVNSSNYISTNEKYGKEFLKNNIELENMEFYAIMKVAQTFNIPVAGIFIVTNYTNENAHKDFIKNHKNAMNQLTLYLKNKNLI